jgi:type IV secretory pathway VirB4 component
LCPDLKILDDYSNTASDSYWEEFPKNSLPDTLSCDVNIQNLVLMCNEKEHLLTSKQILRANTCIENLMEGASSLQKDVLPACFQSNANNTVTYGKEVADAIASWVSKGFVAGPFDNPP